MPSVVAAALACLLAGTATAEPTETVSTLYGWQGAAGPSTATFSDVAIDGVERVLSGYIYDGLSETVNATLFASSLAPGAPLALYDLGFTVEPSVAVSIASQGAGRYWVAISQSDGITATTTHSLDWQAGSPSNVLTQRLGPPPGLSTNVSVHGVNRAGTLVGRLDGTTAVVSPSGGDSWVPSGPVDSEMFAVSPDGEIIGGTADFGTGTSVATIWDDNGTVVYQDTVAGRIRDVAPPFAVGERDGVATWWRRIAGVWQTFELSESGSPLAGELLALDRDGFGITGGSRAGGGAIVVNLRTSQVTDLDDALGLLPGTLWAVHGVDADGGTGLAAFAVEATDFSGWDVTASFTFGPEPVPGPGAWTMAALLLTGCGLLRARSSQVSDTARDSGFP